MNERFKQKYKGPAIRPYVSNFYSQEDYIQKTLKEELDKKNAEPVKIIKEGFFDFKELTRAQKAHALARKYAQDHYIMKKLRYCKSLSEKQVDLIFDIAIQIKRRPSPFDKYLEGCVK